MWAREKLHEDRLLSIYTENQVNNRGSGLSRGKGQNYISRIYRNVPNTNTNDAPVPTY